MSEIQGGQGEGPGEPGAAVEDLGLLGRARLRLGTGSAWAKSAADRHVSIAVPFRAAERNRRVAASVIAGGIAYRLFLWLLPFGLIVGGALGLGDADGVEDAVASGGLPQAFVTAIGDTASAANSNSWWLLLTGVPLLLWEGYAGAKALHLIHGLVWNDPYAPRPKPVRSSLIFSGGMCVFIAAVSLTWWFRDATQAAQWLIFAAMIVPLAALWLWVSLQLPHGSASWKALLPGALLVAIGFQVMHGLGRVPAWAEARAFDIPLRRARGHGDDPLLHVGCRVDRYYRSDPQQLAPRRTPRKQPKAVM